MDFFARPSLRPIAHALRHPLFMIHEEFITMTPPTSASGELNHIHWLTFDEARQLDLPAVTRWAIDLVEQRIKLPVRAGKEPAAVRFSRGGPSRSIFESNPLTLPVGTLHPCGNSTMQSTLSEAKAGHLTGYGSASYRHYVLLLLMLVYTLNFIDRTIAVVAQPIIESFQLTDAQWGLLYGPPFAIFYAVMGLPIALWADRSNRVHIISLCIVLWSIMTALCGVAIGFFTLLMFRIGVAIGEAGCTPPANSLIGDYFIARKRATALGVYSMGVTLGSCWPTYSVAPSPKCKALMSATGCRLRAPLALRRAGLGQYRGLANRLCGGGSPGVLVAMLVWMTIENHLGGYSDPPSQSADRAPDWSETSELKRKPSFWWMAIAASWWRLLATA